MILKQAIYDINKCASSTENIEEISSTENIEKISSTENIEEISSVSFWRCWERQHHQPKDKTDIQTNWMQQTYGRKPLWILQ